MNNWQAVKQILADALELDPGQRVEFLDQRCAGQPELRTEVEELIPMHNRVDWMTTILFCEPEPAADSFTLRPGSLLGPYAILRELGRGSAGVVYLARRDDPFRKLVAVKVLFPHIGTGEFARRFHVERQILAALEHPSIARLLDGGVATTGEPYLVTEYIEGLPLDEYCRANGLSIRRRIELFQQACDAVDYVHRRFIVHRDLKPANILVTAEGQLKLLDFGIAKLLDPGAITRTGFEMTRYGLHPMTPEYASPEQARGEQITTASDVYSLGVLLYLVLAGRLPYAVGGESLHAFIQSICEQEPARLRNLPRDLESVTLRALEKRPDARYLSSAALGEDLGAWLDGRPVRAARATRLYHARKFVRRHSAGVLAASLAVASLCAGLGTALYQWQAAIEQRDRAESLRVQSERRLDENQRLAKTFLFDAAGKLAAAAPSRETRRGILLQAGSILDRLAIEAGNDTGPLDLAESYLHLSAMLSDPAGPGPADPEYAQQTALHAQRILARRTARAPQDSRSQYLLASCYVRLGDAYFFGAEYQGSLASYHEAGRRFKRLFDSISQVERERLRAMQLPTSHITPHQIRDFRPVDQGIARDRFAAVLGLGNAYIESGFNDKALEIHLATLDAHESIVRQYPGDLHFQSRFGILLMYLGDGHARRRDLPRARALYLDARRVFRGIPVHDASEEQFRKTQVGYVDGRLHALDASR